MGAPRNLFDILVCPATGGELTLLGGALRSRSGASYPVRDGVPVLLRDPDQKVEHEGELNVWNAYEPTLQFMFDSLPPDALILDLGSGNRALDLPQVVRADVVLTPHVDVVMDAHDLPFRDESFSLVYASAVFEHLHTPWRAADEIWRILKPGGYVIADCNFVFPFHGFPAVYFNASGEGMKRLFTKFTELACFAAPWQMPSYAIKAVLGEFVRLFRPKTEGDTKIMEALGYLQTLPLDDADNRFDPKDAMRIAAATTYIGCKQPRGDDSLLPECVLKEWRADTALQTRFPKPNGLIVQIASERVENMFDWARLEGAARSPEIASWLNSRVPFDKRGRT